MIVPIDFKSIFKETGVSKGRIFYSPTWKSWVVAGHPEIDLVCIEPPKENGFKVRKIVDNCWFYDKLKEKVNKS